MSKQIGNTYTASVWINLAYLVSALGSDLANKNLVLFSYGSGALASMIQLSPSAHEADAGSGRLVFSLEKMQRCLDISSRLTARVQKQPADLDAALAAREAMHSAGAPYTPVFPVEGGLLAPGAYYLTELNANWERHYARVPPLPVESHKRPRTSSQRAALSSAQVNADLNHVRAAIAESAAAARDGNMPFGAVLADSRSGTELLRARNMSIPNGVRGGGSSMSSSDCTRHAEMELIRQLCAESGTGGVLAGKNRSDMTIYTSTEPCVMCAGAIFWSGIGRVCYACPAKQLNELAGGGGFDISIRELYASGGPAATAGRRQVAVRGPVLAAEALEVHRACGQWGHSSAENNPNPNPNPNPSISASASASASADTIAVSADVALERSLRAAGQIGTAAAPAEGAGVTPGTH